MPTLYNNSPVSNDWFRINGLGNHILFQDTPWIGNTSNRTEQPPDDDLDEALETAIGPTTVGLYVDDSQNLPPAEVLHLALRIKAKSGLPVYHYGNLFGGNRHVANILNNNQHADALWNEHILWESVSWRGQKFANCFDGYCPSIYLYSDVGTPNGLSKVQAWQLVACENLLATSNRLPHIPIIPFIGILDSTEAASSSSCTLAAKILARWQFDYILWGASGEPDQTLFSQKLQEQIN